MNYKEIRMFYLYEFRLGRNAVETARNINQAFGEGIVTERTIQNWFKKFRSGNESLENEDYPGRPSKLNKQKLKDIIEADPCLTVREVAKLTQVSSASVSRHLKSIGKTKKQEKWIPHESTKENKIRRYNISLAAFKTFIFS